MSRITVDRRAHELQCKAHGELLEEIAHLRARVRALEDGLRPFAAVADWGDRAALVPGWTVQDNTHVLFTCAPDPPGLPPIPALGAFRRARALLEES